VTGDRLLHRASALSILLLLVAACAGIVVVSAEGLSSRNEDLERSRRLLAGYQRIAVQRPQIEQRLVAVRQAEAALPGLWQEATAELTASRMQSEVRRLVEGAGAQIRTIQPVPAAAENGFERFGLRLELAVPMTALPRLLQAIEAHAPYLFLDKLDVRAPEGQVSGVPLLTIRGDVSGYRAGKPS
jgi:type IV pilus biogenesis protein CpaD/CtpE